MRSAQKGRRRPKKKPLLFFSGSIIIRVIFLVRFDWQMITLVVKLALLQLIREVNVHGLEGVEESKDALDDICKKSLILTKNTNEVLKGLWLNSPFQLCYPTKVIGSDHLHNKRV